MKKSLLRLLVLVTTFVFGTNVFAEDATIEAKFALTEGDEYTYGQSVTLLSGETELAILTFGDATVAGNNFKAAAADSHVDGFTAYTAGNGTNGNEANGTFYVITPTMDGTVTVAVVLNGGKKFYVEEDGTPLADYNGITEAEKYYGTYKFPVTAGKSYKVYCAGSKLGFYGFIFSNEKEEGGEEGGEDTPATNKTWNFSEWTAGDITAQTTVDGLTVEATADKKVTIDASNKTVDGVSYTQRLKLGGSGNAKYRNLHFDVAGPCKITVVGAHSSSTGDNRNLNIAAGSFDNIIDEGMVVVAGENPIAYTYEYTGEASTIYLYSANSGINLYAIYVEASEEGGEEEPVVTIAKPYFEFNGQTYESGSEVAGLKTGDRVTIHVAEGMYIYTNWSSKTGGSKDSYYVAERMKGQTSYGASTSSGGQRVLYAVAGDTEDATGNSSDLAYIVFPDVVANDPVLSPESGMYISGSVITVTVGCKDDIVYYTTDGTDPTTESESVKSTDGSTTFAICTLTDDMVLKAMATDKNSKNASQIVTEEYTVISDMPVIGDIIVKISESTFATFYYGAADVQVPSEVTAYTVTVNGNQAQLNEIEDGIIPAATAVVINGPAGEYSFVYGDEIVATTSLTSDLVGTDEGGKFGETGKKFYVLSYKDSNKNIEEVGFYWQNGSNGDWAEVNPNQAYLVIDSATAPEFGMAIGEQTGIKTIENTVSNNAAYTLSGVRVNNNQMQKGIYIINGKKVVIK